MSNSKFEYVKKFESHLELLPNTYIVVRIDGKAFTKFTSSHTFKKPNDIQGIKLMLLSALSVMKSYTEIFISYGQSDEFSFAFKKSANLYNRRSEKILTNIVSLFTSSYVFYWNKIFPNKPLKYAPSFDGRIILYPSLDNLKDYFSWRYADCHINNLYNTTFWKLVDSGLSNDEAHNKLKGTFAKDKNEILFSQFGVNYNNEPEVYKKGTVIVRLREDKGKDKKDKMDKVKKDNKDNKDKEDNINNINNDTNDNNININVNINKGDDVNIIDKGGFKCDGLIYQGDDFMKGVLEGGDMKGIAVWNCDVIKEGFWNKEIIDFD